MWLVAARARARAHARSPATHRAHLALSPAAARVAWSRPLYPIIAPDEDPNFVVKGDYNQTVLNFGSTSRPFCAFQPSVDLAARLEASAEAEKVRVHKGCWWAEGGAALQPAPGRGGLFWPCGSGLPCRGAWGGWAGGCACTPGMHMQAGWQAGRLHI